MLILMSTLLKIRLWLLSLFWRLKDVRQKTRLWHLPHTSLLTQCLRLHFRTLCWYPALFEGIVRIANAACTPLRPSSLQRDIASIPNVNAAEWRSGTTSRYSLQLALPAQVNCPLSAIIKALPSPSLHSLSLAPSLSLSILLTIPAITTSSTSSTCCLHMHTDPTARPCSLNPNTNQDFSLFLRTLKIFC